MASAGMTSESETTVSSTTRVMSAPPTADRIPLEPSLGRDMPLVATGGEGRRRQPLDHHVDDRGTADSERARARRLALVGPAHQLAVAAQRFGELIVARGEQVAADRTLGAVVAKLQRVLGVPARVVADHDHDR